MPLSVSADGIGPHLEICERSDGWFGGETSKLSYIFTIQRALLICSYLCSKLELFFGEL